MDLGSRDPAVQTTNTSERPSHGFGKYLRRLRSAFKFRGRPNKAPKHVADSHAGASSEARKFDTSEPLDISQPILAQPRRQLDIHPDPPTSIDIDIVPNEAPVPPHLDESNANTLEDEKDGIPSRNPSLAQQTPNPPLDHRTERARELFARYGFELDPDLDPYRDRPMTTGQIQRVEKPIRVRVHHHCHHCTLAIGPTNICVNCGHKLCKKCHRVPDRKPGGQQSSRGRKREAPSPTRSETLDNWLSVPSSSLALRPLARDSNSTNTFVTRRLHKLCHNCSSPFIWTERICQNCDHHMCNRCPVEPLDALPKQESPASTSSTLPQPYRGRERIFKRPRLRVRYSCEHCGSLFEESSKVCTCCGHNKCGSCPRDPPKRGPTPEPNSDILESLKRRLGSWTNLTPSPLPL